jgi:hypothetical protein
MFYSEGGDLEIANFTKSGSGILVIDSKGFVIIFCFCLLNMLQL